MNVLPCLTPAHAIARELRISPLLEGIRAEYASYIERVRCAKQIDIIFARLLVSPCNKREARDGFRCPCLECVLMTCAGYSFAKPLRQPPIRWMRAHASPLSESLPDADAGCALRSS
jgi:hypothetical protein